MNDNEEKQALVTLLELFKQVPDPRSRHGRRHPLHAILTLTATATMSGAKSLAAISEFGRDRPELAAALGFTRDDLPCAATLSNTLRKTDMARFEAIMRDWNTNIGRKQAAHIDGKTLRGSKHGDTPAPHLLAIFNSETAVVLSQMPVEDTNELKAGLELLGRTPLDGVTVTADAAFTHEDTAKAILEGGGDYILAVKNNQKTLLDGIKDGFEGRPFSPCGARA